MARSMQTKCLTWHHRTEVTDNLPQPDALAGCVDIDAGWWQRVVACSQQQLGGL